MLIIGIDLARKSAHDAAIIRRESALQVGRSFRFHTTPKGIDHLFKRIKAVQEENEPIVFVMDACGKAWIPLAALFKSRGLTVYRPSSDRVRRIRQAGHKKNKTNRIDALTLARCLLFYPNDTTQVFLPHNTLAKLDQLVRQRDRIVDSLRRRKQRIQDLCEAINPTLTKAMKSFIFTEPGRAFLRHYLDPRSVIRLGKNRLTRFLANRYRLHQLESETVEDIFQVCHDAATLYQHIREKGLLPFDATALQDEMNWELDQLEREEERVKALESDIKKLNQQLDPANSLISLPGIQHILAAGIRTCVGDIDRFNSITKHRGFAGFYPSVSKTGDRKSAGRPISKMSCNRYKRVLYLAAENAYKWDLELANFYHNRREAGLSHTQAVCAVANTKLLPRIHHMLKEIKRAQHKTTLKPRYVFRDLNGNPISKAEAKTLIIAKWGDDSNEKKILATA